MQQRSVDSSFSTTLLLIRLLLTKKCVVPMPPHVSLSVCLSFFLAACLSAFCPCFSDSFLATNLVFMLASPTTRLWLPVPFVYCLFMTFCLFLSFSLSLSVLFSLPYSLSSVSSCLRPSVVSVFICLVVWSLLLVY